MISQKAIEVGTEHELEHTSDRRIARQIAMDHLREDPRYYEKLARAGLGAYDTQLPKVHFDRWASGALAVGFHRILSITANTKVDFPKSLYEERPPSLYFQGTAGRVNENDWTETTFWRRFGADLKRKAYAALLHNIRYHANTYDRGSDRSNWLLVVADALEEAAP